MSETRGGATILRHANGQEFVVGSYAPDDAERIACPRAGEFGHTSCGVYACCGWPRFLADPCAPSHPGASS